MRGLVATALAGLVLAISAAAGNGTPSGWIVFASNLSPAAVKLDGRVGASRVHAFSIDGSPRIDFSAGVGPLSDQRASLSPDGRRIAFFRGDPENVSAEL